MQLFSSAGLSRVGRLAGGHAAMARVAALLDLLRFVCWSWLASRPCWTRCVSSAGHGSRRGLAGLAAFRLLVMALVAGGCAAFA